MKQTAAIIRVPGSLISVLPFSKNADTDRIAIIAQILLAKQEYGFPIDSTQSSE